MIPLVKGEEEVTSARERKVRFSLRQSGPRVVLEATDENGSTWNVAMIKKDGLLLIGGIDRNSGIPVDDEGRIWLVV